MGKKNRRILIIVGVVIFAISFGITMMNSESEKKEKTQAVLKEESSLIKELGQSKDMNISGYFLENIKVKDDFLNDFIYYLNNSEKITTKVELEKLVYGNSKNLKFATDYKLVKLYTDDKAEYYKIKKEDEKDFKALIEKEIYTSFKVLKENTDWDEVNIQYRDKEKSLEKINMKNLSNNVNFVANSPDYNLDNDENNFNLTIKVKGKEIHAQTLKDNVVGIYYGDYKSYYQITPSLKKYLDDIFYVKTNNKTDINSEYSWVDSIDVEDVVNNVEDNFTGNKKEELIKNLFNTKLKPSKFDEFEVKRYKLRLKGASKSEAVVVYENFIFMNNTYYKIDNIGFTIDSIVVGG